MIIFPTKKNYSKSNFYREYIEKLNACLIGMNLKTIISITDVLKEKIVKKKNIFVCGNGGSASVSNHFLCDFNKGIKLSSNKKILPKVISLSNSLELITAIGNDIGFEKIFSSQLENYATSSDCIILFSCSGTSKNIKDTIKVAKKIGLTIILITGFNNKKSEKVKLHLDLNCKNYGITEDIFSSLMHMISQQIRFESMSKKERVKTTL
jgi:D-sedoheptulose 7-phosphate isomerase